MGVHMALLTGMGVVSTPVLGWLSDKFNRKFVLAPGLAISVALSVLIVNVGGGLGLTFALATMGLFTFALHQIIQASVLDNVSRGSEATAIGFLFGASSIVGAFSNLVAVVIINEYGVANIFYYQAALSFGALLLVLPLGMSRIRESRPAKPPAP